MTRSGVTTMRIFAGAALAALIAGAAWSQAAAPAAPASAAKPKGWSDQSYYLPMKDGTRVAVSLWFPDHKLPTTKVPVLLVQTRYGRAGIYNYNESGHYDDFRQAGYVVAVIDTRGSTASFGPRDVEIGPGEIADMNTLIEHFKTRPWSNGQVFTAGVSYMADTADIAGGANPPPTATIVRESDFDAYLDLFFPGGVSNDFMWEQWGGETLRRDMGRSVDPKLGLDCGLRVQDCAGLYPRMQPVDEDKDYALIRQAIAGRRRWTPEDYKDVEFRDDRAKNGYRLDDSSPFMRLPEIRKERVPTQYWGGWMDAGTADAAIARYRATPDIPTEVIIHGNDHGGDQSTDPFFPGENPPLPAFTDQVAKMEGFLADVRADKPIGRNIHYYVLGAKVFHDTKVWPPEGVKPRRLELAPAHALAPAGAKLADGSDRYAVDFTATTGEATRWTTQIGVAAAYPDRREADQKLIAYTSAPFDADMELAGRPSVDLFMTSETKDPAVFVYLEDVAPDGRVTYITEGMLRGIDRRLADPKTLPYPQDAPAHSFLRKDAEAVVPGKVFEMRFTLFPVAALIRKGHAVRIAIAGADANFFRRYSEGKPDAFTLYRSKARRSSVEIPLRPWR
jgi:putative CocE/NonD family hydrolase